MHRCHSQNTMGSPMYPPGTNHFNPNSPLFKSEQRTSVYWTCCPFWWHYSNSRLSNLFFLKRHFNRPFQPWCKHHGMFPLLHGTRVFFMVLFDSICCELCLREDFVNWLILGWLPSSWWIIGMFLTQWNWRSLYPFFLLVTYRIGDSYIMHSLLKQPDKDNFSKSSHVHFPSSLRPYDPALPQTSLVFFTWSSSYCWSAFVRMDGQIFLSQYQPRSRCPSYVFSLKW